MALNQERALFAGCLAMLALLVALGIRANIAQSRIEAAIGEQADVTKELTTYIHGELTGMSPDYSTTIDCDGDPMVISTTCGQGPGVPPGESDPDCLARHRARVQAAKDACANPR